MRTVVCMRYIPSQSMLPGVLAICTHVPGLFFAATSDKSKSAPFYG